MITPDPLATPHGPCGDGVDFDRTRSTVMHRLFGTTPKVIKLGRFEVVGSAGAGEMGRVYVAFDPELDRTVAIKVVRDIDIDAAQAKMRRERLAREARALAKVSHPNVIGIYEVGHLDEDLFIVMEYVPGPSLRSWLAGKERSPGEITDVLAGAARGLAAAHRAGLVHRDFKPENMVVGADLRAVVLDFGLARAADTTLLETQESPTSLSSPHPDQVTRTGATAGTPAYMAPEQFQGAAADERSDQFSFCVAAWEAFTGERPFLDGSTAGAMVRRQTSEPPSQARRWLDRGLALEPEKRWPSMEVLLATIERGRTRTRKRWIIAGVAVAATLAIGVEGYRQFDLKQHTDACVAVGDTIDEVWNAESREALRAGLVATGANYAPVVAQRVGFWVDQQAEAWREASTQTCLAGEVKQSWDAARVGRTTWCLDERRVQLATLVSQMAEADATVLQNAVQAASELSPVDPCMDPRTLAGMAEPPGPELRERVTAVRQEIQTARYLQLTGKHVQGLTLAASAREHAQALEWPPLRAAAQATEAQLLEDSGRYAEAEAAGTAAYMDAASSGTWDVAADAASRLTFVVGFRLARYEDGKAWGKHAGVAIAHAGDVEGLREATRANQLGVVHSVLGETQEALALFERALSLREQRLGTEHPFVAGTLHNLARVRSKLGEYEAAEALDHRALDIRERTLGPEHPDVAQSLESLGDHRNTMGQRDEARELYARALEIKRAALGSKHPAIANSLNHLAVIHRKTGELTEAILLYEEAIAIKEAALDPDHPDVAGLLNNLGNVLLRTDQMDRAKAVFERAMDIRERSQGPDHPEIASSLAGLGQVYRLEGDLQTAKTLLIRGVAIDEKAYGPEHPRVARGLSNLAGMHFELGEHAEARELFERAIVIKERKLGVNNPSLAFAVSGLGKALTALGESEKAIEQLDRAVALRSAGGVAPELLASSRFFLAKQLWDAAVGEGRDRERAGELAAQARDAFTASASADTELGVVEAWIAAHGG